MKAPFILQRPMSDVVEHYKEPIEFANKQLEIFWLPDEIKVEKDIQDVLVNMSEAERHGVMTVLKLFTIYEIKAGSDYWNGKYTRIFKRPEFRRMASVFSMFELAVHAPFYRKLNEVLHLDNDDFYLEYVNDPTLKARMEFIDGIVSSKNDLLSLAAFSIVEGAILYSSFAFLKHFQSQGKNKLLNVVRGINFSVRDENCLDSSTEVLTTSGWKYISEISLNDKVCQYDTNTGIIDYVYPSNITSTISHESITFESESIHQRVTPNHRIVTDSGVKFAHDVIDTDRLVLCGNKISGDDYITDDDKIAIKMIVSGNLGVNWIYEKMEYVSSKWAKEAIEFYLALISE